MDAFRFKVVAAKEVRSPTTRIGEWNFMHVQKNDVFLVAVTKLNVNAAMAFTYLHRLVTILESYFAGDLTCDAVKGNYVMCYSLFDGTYGENVMILSDGT